MRRCTRATIGQHIDLIKRFERKDRFQNHHHRQDRPQERQGHVAKDLPTRSTIDLGGFLGLFGHRGQAADEHQSQKRNPPPDVSHDTDGKGQHRLGKPIHMGQRRYEPSEERIKQTEFGIEHKPERHPDQGRRHGKRNDEQRLDGQPKTATWGQQQRQPQGQRRRQCHGDDGIDARHHHRIPKGGFFPQRPRIVVSADEALRECRPAETPLIKGEAKRGHERPDGGGKHHQHRRHHQQVLQVMITHYLIRPARFKTRFDCLAAAVISSRTLPPAAALAIAADRRSPTSGHSGICGMMSDARSDSQAAA